MAGRKHAFYFSSSIESDGNGDEFDESEVWGYPVEPVEPVRSKPIPASGRSNRKKTERSDRVTAPASMPLNIPDWSKILKHEYRGGNHGNSYNTSNGLFESDGEGEVTGAVIPPHELLCRNRAASFSVHEGMGRTLKGRDLSRVRNAIFEKMGFQD